MVMNKKELAPGILVYSGIIDNTLSLINDIEKSVHMQEISWKKAYVTSDKEIELNTNTRDTEIIRIPYLMNQELNNSNKNFLFLNTLSKIFFDAFDKYENHYKGYHGISTTSHESFGLLKYSVGQKFTNHIDDHKDYIRRISTVYYMNDDYSGGEINFPRFGISYKPKKDELLIFPSNFVYNHSVSEVTEGTRYSVVSWMH